MADPAFFVDGDFDELARDLFDEFGVDAILRRRTYAAVIGDARAMTENPPQDYAVKCIDGGALQAFAPNIPVRNSQSLFFPGLGVPFRPNAESDFIVLKAADNSLTEELKVTEYRPVMRGLESVILWEAVREN